MGSEIVWLDLETGGLDEDRHQIIQVAAIATEAAFPFAEVGTFEAKIKLVPGYYTEEALAKNCYTPEGWESALPSAVARTEFERFIYHHRKHTHISGKGNRLTVAELAGHNLDFDVKFLRKWFGKIWLPATAWTGGYFDSMHIARTVTLVTGRRWKNHTLEGLCEELGIEFDAHDALEDVRASIRLTKELILILTEGRNSS